MKWFRRREKRTPEEGQWEGTQDEVRAAKQSRLTQTATRRDLVDAISAVLFKADPVGINFDTNTDEYDAEAETIVIALPRAAGPDDVRSLTHEAFVQRFDAETAGPIEGYTAVAHEIWSLWRRHEGQSGLRGVGRVLLPQMGCVAVLRKRRGEFTLRSRCGELPWR